MRLIEQVAKEFNPGRIIELGTLQGGLTILLANACPEARIETFDLNAPRARIDEIPRVCFTAGDILDRTSGAYWGIVTLAHSGLQKILYCDNGHKEEEMAMYAPHLQPGDLLGCHDYGTEVHPENIKEALKGFEPYHHDLFERAGVTTRFWRRL